MPARHCCNKPERLPRRSRAGLNALLPLLACFAAANAPVRCAPPIPAAPLAPADTAEASARIILQRYKLAAGGNAWDQVRSLHIKLDFSSNGSSGSAEQWEDAVVGRKLDASRIGDLRSADGFDGRRAWMRRAKEPSVPSDGPAEQHDAVSLAYQMSNSYWYCDRMPGQVAFIGKAVVKNAPCDGVGIAPDNGTPFEMWFDQATGLLSAIVEQHALDTTTYTFGKYRTVDFGFGSHVLVPFEIVITNGNSQDDTEIRRKSVDVNAAIADGMFSMPSDFVADYDFTHGAASASVPLTILNNHLFVPAKINGNDAYALFDTGGHFVISPAAAMNFGMLGRSSSAGSSDSGLGVDGYINHPFSGQGFYDSGEGGQGAGYTAGGGSSDESSGGFGYVKADTVAIGGLKIKRPLLQLNPNITGSNALAIVGSELLSRFIVSINFDTSTLTLIRPDAFKYAGSGIVLPFRFHEGHIPLVEGVVDGMPGTFTIDTGDNRGLTLNGPFNLANGLKDKYKPKFAAISGYGLRGPDEAYVVRTHTLTLGGATVHDRVTFLRGGSAGDGADRFVAGSIGVGVLREFNIIFDYPDERIILEPDKQFGAADAYQRSGIVFDLYKIKPTIAEIVPGSPADAAGLAVGDTILSIDGVKSGDKNALDKFRTFNYQPSGTVVTIRFKHPKGKVRTATLLLRDLV